jgi:hypothetical protein
VTVRAIGTCIRARGLLEVGGGSLLRCRAAARCSSVCSGASLPTMTSWTVNTVDHPTGRLGVTPPVRSRRRSTSTVDAPPASSKGGRWLNPASPETSAMVAPTTSAANEYHDARATPSAAVSAARRASASTCGLDASTVAEASAPCARCVNESVIVPAAPDGFAAHQLLRLSTQHCRLR